VYLEGTLYTSISGFYTKLYYFQKMSKFSKKKKKKKKKKAAFLKEQFYFDFSLLFFLKEILYHCSSGMISYSKF
jgi:hypothetical protein